MGTSEILYEPFAADNCRELILKPRRSSSLIKTEQSSKYFQPDDQTLQSLTNFSNQQHRKLPLKIHETSKFAISSIQRLSFQSSGHPAELILLFQPQKPPK